MQIYTLEEEDFSKIIKLGNRIHGKNYLDKEAMEKVLSKSFSKEFNCSYVAYDTERGGKLIGFRLTYAPGNWEVDKWCTPNLWGVLPEKICYLKCNTIEAEYRRQGVGSKLLNKSIESVKKMGGVAAVTHIWMESPGGSAMKYFAKAGGRFVMLHPNRWLEDCIISNYRCIRHGDCCTCSAAEMILYFGEQDDG